MLSSLCITEFRVDYRDRDAIEFSVVGEASFPIKEKLRNEPYCASSLSRIILASLTEDGRLLWLSIPRSELKSGLQQSSRAIADRDGQVVS